MNETSGNVVIALDFDDGFIYSTNGSNPSFMKSGSSFSVGCHTSEHHSERIGDEITLSPLVTYDVELYLRCAKAVAEQTDKPLVFSQHKSSGIRSDSRQSAVMRAITMTECSSAKTEQPNEENKAAAAPEAAQESHEEAARQIHAIYLLTK